MTVKTKATGQRIGYRRVSTLDQSTARQLEVESFDRICEDKLSGKDTNRPQLQAMLKHVREATPWSFTASTGSAATLLICRGS